MCFLLQKQSQMLLMNSRSRKKTAAVWFKINASVLSLNYNNDFIMFLQLYMEEELCSK